MITLYEAFKAGTPSPLPDLPIQYSDFAIWQRERLKGDLFKKHVEYWETQLKDAPSFELPADHARPPTQTFNGMRHWIELPPDLSRQIISLSQAATATPFIALLAAFKILLNRYTGREELIIGTHVAGRNNQETEKLIGFFVNQLPLRASASGSLTFRELINQIRQAALEVFHYQDVPFEKVVEALGVKHDPVRRPFFQILFSFHNAPRPPLEVPGLKLTIMQFDDNLVRFDLEIDLWWNGSAIEGFLAHNTDLYEQATIEKLIKDYQDVLSGVVLNPDRRISELPQTPR
jgi:non-ribosomal peptide synthetase component F